MNPRRLNTIGLMLGIVGVLIVFKWGPPQPTMESGISLGLEDATPIDKQGKTVADHNREMSARRLKHKILSRVGLAFIGLAFGFQLWAVWVPESRLIRPGGDAPEDERSPLSEKSIDQVAQQETAVDPNASAR